MSTPDKMPDKRILNFTSTNPSESKMTQQLCTPSPPKSAQGGIPMTDSDFRFPSVLIVTPEDDLRSDLQHMALECGANSVTTAPSLSAMPDAAFWNASLAIVDLDAINGVHPKILKRTSPLCWVVAVGDPSCSPPLWRLLQWGVDDFLAKPFSIPQLQQRLLDLPPDLLTAAKELAKSWVGCRGVKDVQAEIRATMYHEALARTDGNKCQAARLLQVTRAAVQKELRGY